MGTVRMAVCHLISTPVLHFLELCALACRNEFVGERIHHHLLSIDFVPVIGRVSCLRNFLNFVKLERFWVPKY